MSSIRYIVDNHVATIVVDNPPQNRLDVQMFDDLSRALDVIAAGDARAVLLRAEGPNFSFGGDITPWADWGLRELRSAFDRYAATCNKFEQFPLPVIAAVQGLCFGGGFELALRSDVIFAGESARFGHPEQTLGIVTLLGGIYRVAERAGRARAYEWALTSEKVSAATMADVGVVNHVVPDDELLDHATAFAARIAAGPTRAHAAHKALLRAWAVGGVAAADQAMFDIAVPLFETEDVKGALAAAIDAFHAGEPRQPFPFAGR